MRPPGLHHAHCLLQHPALVDGIEQRFLAPPAVERLIGHVEGVEVGKSER